MSPDALAILAHLGAVKAERDAQALDPGLGARVRAVKHYQHRRFARTYDDLLHDPGRAAAAGFFLADLYGARDFSERDAQFGRIVSPLDRLFSAELVHTVRELAELHDLSERMDHRMARALDTPAVDAARYAAAWCRVGEPAVRERQVALMLAVGGALVGYTRSTLLRHSLRLMRSPARLAGLEALHTFLERGFDTFRALRNPQGFLDTVATRERRLAAALFARSAPLPPDLPD